MEALVTPLISLIGILLGITMLWLRNDINALRSDMNRGFDKVADRFEKVDATLHDHGQRLTRIETHLELTHPHDPTST